MPIIRSSYQGTKTLQEFYTEIAINQNEVFAKGANQMIEFIQMINITFPKTRIWAHTSHTRLGIQPLDDEFLTSAIFVSNVGVDQFYFEFKLPKSRQPWKDAWVTGKVNSLEEAKKYLLISMEESDEWKDNIELKDLTNKMEKK